MGCDQPRLKVTQCLRCGRRPGAECSSRQSWPLPAMGRLNSGSPSRPIPRPGSPITESYALYIKPYATRLARLGNLEGLQLTRPGNLRLRLGDTHWDPRPEQFSPRTIECRVGVNAWLTGVTVCNAAVANGSTPSPLGALSLFDCGGQSIANPNSPAGRLCSGRGDGHSGARNGCSEVSPIVSEIDPARLEAGWAKASRPCVLVKIDTGPASH